LLKFGIYVTLTWAPGQLAIIKLQYNDSRVMLTITAMTTVRIDAQSFGGEFGTLVITLYCEIINLLSRIDERPQIQYKKLVAGKAPSLFRRADTIVDPSLYPAR
jgi:hypothetical protein